MSTQRGRLEYVHGAPADQLADMVLCTNEGDEVYRYRGCRPFNRVQRQGVWWRLAGMDRKTRELIYLAEEVLT